jgi:hypothetical protein
MLLDRSNYAEENQNAGGRVHAQHFFLVMTSTFCVWGARREDGTHVLMCQTGLWKDAESDAARRVLDPTISDVVIIEHPADEHASLIVTLVSGTIEKFRHALDENRLHTWTLAQSSHA